MKRIVGLVAALTALGAWLAGPAFGSPTPPNPDRDAKPACADIKDGFPSISGPGTATYTVTLDEYLFDTACKNIDYTLTVTNRATGAVIGTATPVSGDGVNAPLHYSLTVADSQVNHFSDNAGNTYEEVCLAAQTSRNKNVIDNAPDTGCITVDNSPFPPGGRMR